MAKTSAKPRGNQVGYVPPTSKFKNQPDGGVSVQWGQDAWLAIAEQLQPRRAEITPDLPRTAFARLVFDAAQAAFPDDERMHRSFNSLLVGIAPSSNYIVIRQTLAALEQYEKIQTRKVKDRERKATSRAASKPALRVVEAPMPAPAKAPAAVQNDPLAAFLNMPVGNLLPLLRTLMAGVMADAFAPVLARLDAGLATIEPKVKAAIEDALGAPTPQPTNEGIPTPREDTEPAAPVIPATPPAAPPAPQPDTPETVAEKAELAKEVMGMAAEALAPMQPAKPIKVKAAHSLADQLEAAAPLIGLENCKRKHVVVCGLHPKVMDELEHKHREFRFTYIKQGHLNEADDIPASTDALILSRKKLNSFVMGAVRRYSIPMRSVANSLPAAEWALREIFDGTQ